MSRDIIECELIRTPERVCEPDPRTQRVIEDQYETIASFKLNESVPEGVVIHFETAKNLYLYAWFVYRFYSVAEHYVLATLEFALRERFPDLVNEQAAKRGLGLKRLLKYAIENGYLKNELFSTRERWAWKRAEMRHSIEMSQKLMASGLDKIEYSDSDVMVTQEDLDSDWLGVFQETIPEIRNIHAHGSGHLYPAPVRHTFEMVSEIINQLYPNKLSS
ncbi:MAG: hypothetical protein ACYCY7_09730 [Gallionella sp.]